MSLESITDAPECNKINLVPFTHQKYKTFETTFDLSSTHTHRLHTRPYQHLSSCQSYVFVKQRRLGSPICFGWQDSFVVKMLFSAPPPKQRHKTNNTRTSSKRSGLRMRWPLWRWSKKIIDRLELKFVLMFSPHMQGVRTINAKREDNGTYYPYLHMHLC